MGCTTQYTGKEEMDDFQVKFLVALNAVLIACNISINTFLIVGMRQTDQLKTMSLRLIFYLAHSDLCVGVVVEVCFIVLLTRYQRNADDCTFEQVASFFGNLFSHTSSYLTFVISLDRFIRARYLLTYHRRFEAIRYDIATTTFVVLISLFHAVIYSLGSQHVMSIKTSTRISIGIELFLIVSEIMLYFASIYIIRQYQRDATSARIVQSMRHFLAVSSRIIFFLLVCYTSYIIFKICYQSLIHRIDQRNVKWLVFGRFCGFAFFYCRAFVNAVIFIYANTALKKKLYRMFCLKAKNKEHVTDSRTQIARVAESQAITSFHE